MAFCILCLLGLQNVAADSSVSTKVVCDNYIYDKSCGGDWGFASVITGLEKTILFDAGAKGDLLPAHLARVHVKPADIQLVVISHNHADHTGGLPKFLDSPAGVEDRYAKQTCSCTTQLR